MAAESDDSKALKHALAALDDGCGHSLWGPGIVGQFLEKNYPKASQAFDTACQVAVKLRHLEPQKMIATMRKLAPVLLEVLTDDEP